MAADRSSKTVRPPIDRTDIERLAYDLYLARGREDGHDLEDWLAAEQSLRDRRKSTAS